MAKLTKKDKDDVALNDDVTMENVENTIVVEEEKPVIDEIKVEKPATSNMKSKIYTIKVKQYTRVFIGEWYTFEPNRIYRVNENVKSKLQSAGLLLPV